MRKLLAVVFFGIALLAQSLTLQHCATPSPPRGGAIDSLGPVLVADETTPNFQTNFRPERIELTFDEWVELDPQQPIVISPPIPLTGDNRPVLRRRTLIIPLTGVDLLDSVTYVLNVGAAIKDLNEGNPTENLRFVFATGPELDTATVTGQLVDAFSGEPLEGADFTLFSNLADTAFFTENPTYFAQTDEEGNFTVFNIKPGRYRAVALQRAQGATNYFADYQGVFPPVAVGFIDSVLTLLDTDNRVGTVRLSPVPVAPRIADFEADNYGEIKLVLNQPAELVDIQSSTDYLRRNDKDTLRLFYRTPVPDTLLIGRDSLYSDTLFFSGEEIGEGPVQSLRPLGKTPGKLNPGEGVRLRFNRPLAFVDTSRIKLLRDTSFNPIPYRYEIDTLYPASLSLSAGWQPDIPYLLQIGPGGVTDWYGQENQDTIERVFNIQPVESFGNLRLVFENLNPAANYILRLIEGDNVLLGTRRYIEKRFDYTVEYRSLKPATYRIELIYDSNGNGRYDSGDLRFGLQPEIVRRFEIEPLRANWDLEEIINLENN